jgi:glucose-1-phosphate thymidylyltransferase
MNSNSKGIVMAGGAGTRLHPITMGISKQLLPIYDKPMIYYPISVLMLSGIRDILVITTPEDLGNYMRLLNDGSQFGVSFSYVVQSSPKGLAEAFILGEEFIGNSNVALVLGDNFFYGQAFSTILNKAVNRAEGATIFGYRVTDPERFGVVEFNASGEVLSIEEKPKHPKSNYAVTGLYFYDNNVVEIAKTITPSVNGELGITDINEKYREKGLLTSEILGRGFAWLDTGTFDSLLASGEFVQTIEKRQGLKVACLEEIGFKKGWVSQKDLIKRAKLISNSAYGEYLYKIARENETS